MNHTLHLLFVSCLALPLICVSGKSGESEFGVRAYADRCVVCHGETGRGAGVVGEIFVKHAPDFQLSSKTNDRLFLHKRIDGLVDGRAVIPGLVQSQMPVWADCSMTEACKWPAKVWASAAMITEGHVPSFVSYL